MALRGYKCAECGHSFDLVFSKEYPLQYKCECGAMAQYHIGNFAFAFTFKYGWDPGAGKGFDSKRQRDNFLAEKELEPLPDGAYDTQYKGK